MPKTNVEYWNAKIARNIERHSKQLAELTASGWTALTIWECELTDKSSLEQRLSMFLLTSVASEISNAK